jgi:hypothetical protein
MKLARTTLPATLGAVLLGLALLPGAGPLAEPVNPPTSTAWGPSEDGLQTGIRLLGNRHRFRRGEVLPLRLLVRNTGREQRQLDFWGPTAWNFRLENAREIAIRATGEQTGYAHLGLLPLPPGDETELPGAGPAVILRDAAWKGDETDFSIPTLRLSPGTYRIRAPRPFRGHGKGSELRRDLLPTGSLEIEILPEPPAESRDVDLYRIAWGQAGEGLQAGLALNSPAEPLHVDETATFNLYLRNRGKVPATLEHTRLRDLDYVPTVGDAAGQPVSVHHIWVSGLLDRMERTLKPAARMLIAHPQLEARAENAEPLGLVPAFLAAPGPYRVRQSFFYQPPDQRSASRHLESGELQVRVLPQRGSR